jgi:hypothetical protein
MSGLISVSGRDKQLQSIVGSEVEFIHASDKITIFWDLRCATGLTSLTFAPSKLLRKLRTTFFSASNDGLGKHVCRFRRVENSFRPAAKHVEAQHAACSDAVFLRSDSRLVATLLSQSEIFHDLLCILPFEIQDNPEVLFFTTTSFGVRRTEKTPILFISYYPTLACIDARRQALGFRDEVPTVDQSKIPSR